MVSFRNNSRTSCVVGCLLLILFSASDVVAQLSHEKLNGLNALLKTVAENTEYSADEAKLLEAELIAYTKWAKSQLAGDTSLQQHAQRQHKLLDKKLQYDRQLAELEARYSASLKKSSNKLTGELKLLNDESRKLVSKHQQALHNLLAVTLNEEQAAQLNTLDAPVDALRPMEHPKALIKLIAAEITLSSMALKFPMPVSEANGAETVKDVWNFWPFALIADGEFLQLDADVQTIRPFAVQPTGHIAEMLQAMDQAAPGEVVGLPLPFAPDKLQALVQATHETTALEDMATKKLGKPFRWSNFLENKQNRNLFYVFLLLVGGYYVFSSWNKR